MSGHFIVLSTMWMIFVSLENVSRLPLKPWPQPLDVLWIPPLEDLSHFLNLLAFLPRARVGVVDVVYYHIEGRATGNAIAHDMALMADPYMLSWLFYKPRQFRIGSQLLSWDCCSESREATMLGCDFPAIQHYSPSD